MAVGRIHPGMTCAVSSLGSSHIDLSVPGMHGFCIVASIFFHQRTWKIVEFDLMYAVDVLKGRSDINHTDLFPGCADKLQI